MLKHLTILCLFIALATQCSAQVNLVPNGSFEEYYIQNGSNWPISGPTSYSNQDSYRLRDWFQAKGSPDLFTYHNSQTGPNQGCLNASNTGWDIPENRFGFQYPRTDSCYMGIAWENYLSAPSLGWNYYAREWAGIKLEDTLKRDHCYRFSMYVSVAENTGYNVSAIGAYFSPQHLYTGNFQGNMITPPLLPYDSVQVFQNPNVLITDTVGWVQVAGEFKAKGNEVFLYIGNLFYDSLYVATPLYPQANDTIYCGFSYLFIDDVSLNEIENPCTMGTIENSNIPISIYPNPAVENVTITLPPNTNKAELLIYTMQGQLLSQAQLNGTQTINTTNLANGLYLFVVQSDGNIVGREKVIIAH